MGDPHYNTWGGKNNSWGNKNRKGKSGGGGPQRDDEKWSKGAKIVAGGVVLLVLANTGLGPVIETAQNVMDVFDFGKDVKEYADTAKSTSKSNSKSSNKGAGKKGTTYEDVYKHIKNNADLEASDVKDILEYLHTKLSTERPEAMDTKKASAVFIDYECFLSEKKYVKNVMEKLEDYEDTVTFVAACPSHLTVEDMNAEFEKITEIIKANLSGYDTVFNQVSMNALSNLPNPGEFIMSVTFYTE